MLLNKLFHSFNSNQRANTYYVTGPSLELDLCLKERNILFSDTLNTFFMYSYVVSDTWLRTTDIRRDK